MKFVKSGFVRERYCLALSDYDKSRNGNKISDTRVSELHGQRVYAIHELAADSRMMNSSMLTTGERDGEEKNRVGKVLSIFCCVREKHRRRWNGISRISGVCIASGCCG